MKYQSEKISIYENTGPVCEIVNRKATHHVVVTDRDDALAIIESLQRFVNKLDSEAINADLLEALEEAVETTAFGRHVAAKD